MESQNSFPLTIIGWCLFITCTKKFKVPDQLLTTVKQSLICNYPHYPLVLSRKLVWVDPTTLIEIAVYTHASQTVLGDNLCVHRVIVTTTKMTRPKWARPSPLGLNFTGVKCRPWSNRTIVILMDSWRPILRCYCDFVRWLILWEHMECATCFEKIICMSSFYQVAKSELEPELYYFVRKFEQIPKRVKRWKWLNWAIINDSFLVIVL